MKIGIHNREGSFSERWAPECQRRGIEYVLLDATDPSSWPEIAKCDILLAQWANADALERKLALSIVLSFEAMGGLAFPNSNELWHFDDKVAQYVLLSQLDLPLVETRVIFNRGKALTFLRTVNYPHVMKLATGASSHNVHLVRRASQGRRLAKKAFGAGFSPSNRQNMVVDKWRRAWGDRTWPTIYGAIRGTARLFVKTAYEKGAPKERGYYYYQKFCKGNDCDFRIIVIGENTFGITRFVRKGDFRASGSGDISYDPSLLDEQLISIAKEASRLIGSRCMAYDFVYDEGEPVLVEMSYAFSMEGYDSCPGYWDGNLDWIAGPFTPQTMILDVVCEQFLTSSLSSK